MEQPNLATIEIKAFVPALDFKLALEFYQALGFRLASNVDGIAFLHCGESSFLLQDFYVKEHADNFQMLGQVEDVEAWHLKAANVAAQYNVKIGEPEDQPWGMRDFVLFDPSGVLWRIAQNIPGAAPVGLLP